MRIGVGAEFIDGTLPDNLVLLCKAHHWMLDEGGWSILRAEDGSVLTVPPRGYHPQPPDDQLPPPELPHDPSRVPAADTSCHARRGSGAERGVHA